MGRGQEPVTFRQRGFGFDYAAGIFGELTLEKRDDRCDYGETRMQAIGRVRGEILFVVYTDRDDVRHIISARRTNRKERRSWQLFAKRWITSGE